MEQEMNLENHMLYRWWRVLYPILLAWIISMAVVTAALWYCQTILAGELRTAGADVFTVDAYWRQRYEKMALGITFVTDVLMCFCMFVLFRLDQKKEAHRKEGLAEKKGVGWYILLIPFGFSLCFTVNGLINLSGLTGLFKEELDALNQSLYGYPLWLEVLTLIIAAPLAEELLFRGLVFRRLRYLFPSGQAIFGSALLFGMYHGNLVQGLYGFFMGLLFAWAYERYESLWAPVLVHISANLLSLAITESQMLNQAVSGTMGRFLTAVLAAGTVGSGCFYLIHEKMPRGKQTEG